MLYSRHTYYSTVRTVYHTEKFTLELCEFSIFLGISYAQILIDVHDASVTKPKKLHHDAPCPRLCLPKVKGVGEVHQVCCCLQILKFDLIFC